MPSIITGEDSYNEMFFKKINEIENKTLDNISFAKLVSDYSLAAKNTGLINVNGINSEGEKNKIIDKKIVNNFFKINNEGSIDFLNIGEKYYIVQLTKESKVFKDLNNKEVRSKVKSQIDIENKIKENGKLAKAITNNEFTRLQMDKFTKEHDLIIEKTTLTKIKGNKVFSEGVIKRIFETDEKSINLITDNMLKDNFIVYTKKTKLPKIDKQNENYKSFELKAKMRLANNIYNIYDFSLNRKYNVEINNKTLNRIKNSF